MVFEVLVGLPLLTIAGYIGFKLNDKIRTEIESDDPRNEFFTIGNFGYKMFLQNAGKKIPGSDYTGRVILYANGHDERKVEFRTSRENVSFEKYIKTDKTYISYIQPWLEKTIDTPKLIEIATDDGFKVAAVNYKKL